MAYSRYLVIATQKDRISSASPASVRYDDTGPGSALIPSTMELTTSVVTRNVPPQAIHRIWCRVTPELRR